MGGLGSLTYATVIALIVGGPKTVLGALRASMLLPLVTFCPSLAASRSRSREVGKTLGIVFFSLSAHLMGFLLPVGAPLLSFFPPLLYRGCVVRLVRERR